MQLSPFKLCLLNGSFLFCLLTLQPTAAQIIPDATLPNNSIVPLNCTNCEITGGTAVGNNLFHSFEQFSIPTSGSAYFNNASTIENIISRVTGRSISNIDGLIRANPTANVFLLNPNGIIFGQNASLDIGGSFVASTASSLNFADGFNFSATNPQNQPLLTITAPIGLQFGNSAEPIVNQSIASPNGALNAAGLPVGLQVLPGKTLALVGGNVMLEGGNITAESGRIELGSVANNNLVNLTQINEGWMLGYEGIQNFQDISLSQVAIVDTSGSRSGDIQIQGRRVTLTQGSQLGSISFVEGQAGNVKINGSESVEFLGVGTFPDGTFFPTGVFAQVFDQATGEGATLTIDTRRLVVRDGGNISTNTFGVGRGLDLIVRASESVEIVGSSPDGVIPSSLAAQVGSEFDQEVTGQGGKITIETKLLTIQNGGQVSAATFGRGRAGDLTVRASESVDLAGTAPDQITPSGLFAQVEEGAFGNAGNLLVETQRLTIADGAQIASTGRSGGSGGTLTINASDSVTLSGFSPVAVRNLGRSGIFVSAEQGATRDAGELNITTGQLTVENGAEISADNFGSGDGGTATITARRLIIQDGGEVRAGSFGEGSGGTLTVNASEFVEIAGSGTIASTPIKSSLFTQAESSGKAGSLNITTPSLTVQDGAEVTVSSIGTGSAGTLTIDADSIFLNRGSLTATTRAGEGANITLQGLDLLLMQNQSLISAEALNNANGGNINIDAADGFVIATPNQNNDIKANAVEGRGGDINITAVNVFGLEERRSTPENTTNDIDASSEFGLSGTVTINTPEVDPVQGLVELPTGVVDASELVASGCDAIQAGEGSEFIITGRGGMPSSPDEALSTDVVWSDTRLISGGGGEKRRVSTHNPRVAVQKNQHIAVVPATGWVFNGKGEVTLVAHSISDNTYRSGAAPASCSKR